MSNETAVAIIALIVGALAGAIAAKRLHSGVSYISRPPTRVTRQEDPFSYWLSLIPLTGVALVFVGGSLAVLFWR